MHHFSNVTLGLLSFFWTLPALAQDTPSPRSVDVPQLAPQTQPVKAIERASTPSPVSVAHAQSSSTDHAPFPQKVVAILVNTNPIIDSCVLEYEEEKGRPLRQPIMLNIQAVSTGEVTQVDVEHRKIKDTPLETCLVQSVQEIPLPSFSGPDVAYKVELSID